MNEEARKVFSELLDVNYELVQAKTSVMKLEAKYRILEDRLKYEMGEEEYNKFIANGKAMFAPKG
jgi:hypothetical protein